MNEGTGQDELEPVMAGMEGSIETNAGNLKRPDKAMRELAAIIAWPQLIGNIRRDAGHTRRSCIFVNLRNDDCERIL